MYIRMLPPISSAIKERVIELHLQGKGRNQIAEILKVSHIRISQGSVTNILRVYEANTGWAYTTTDFTKSTEPTSSPSQLQTSPTPEMKEEAQIPVSEGQEPLSTEDAEGPEHVPLSVEGPEGQEESRMDSVSHTTWKPLVEEPKQFLEAQQVPQAQAPGDQALEESFMDWAAAIIFDIKNEKRMLREAKQDRVLACCTGA
jgi:hypothetical protein